MLNMQSTRDFTRRTRQSTLNEDAAQDTWYVIWLLVFRPRYVIQIYRLTASVKHLLSLGEV